jgi:hypothetical protein
VHNFIPEYASTASILKPFEKKWFSPQISSKPPKSQEMEHKKKKVARDPSNKRGSQYIERRKILQLQKLFLTWFYFLPLHHIIFKTLYKIIEKIFLTLFRPSFSLAIYITWVVPFSFTHELHIFSI